VKNDQTEAVQTQAEKIGFRARLENFAAAQADKFKENSSKNVQPSEPLPVISIPAPQRRRNNAELAAIVQDDHNDQMGDPFGDSSRSGDTAASTPAQSVRLSRSTPISPRDPYHPALVNPENISRRGTLTIVSTPQPPSERVEVRNDSLPHTPNSAIFTSDSPISGRNDITQIPGPSEGMTVTVIPAPPRRRQSEE